MPIERKLTAGMVSPMLASADPNARLRLVCRRFARAARSAASPSGSSTMPAMITPTSAFGAPILATPASRLGASFLASSTTAHRHISSSTELAAVAALLGRAVQKELPVPDGLRKDEGAVDHHRDDGDERELTAGIVGPGRGDGVVRKHQGQDDDRAQRNQCRADAVKTETLLPVREAADQQT